MNIVKTIALSLITGLAFAGAAAAASTDDAARLEVAKQRLASGANSVKPSQASRLRREADELQKLIDTVESGAKVDAQEVDRAIDRSYRGF